MNHRNLYGQRFSPLARINRDNVKAPPARLCGSAGRRAPAMSSTRRLPLAEDGFHLHHGFPGACSTRSTAPRERPAGSSGAWTPKQEQQRQSRGATLWGNFVITAANSPGRVIATDKETGKVAWETTFPDIASVVITTAPLAIKDKIVVGAANSGGGHPGLDRGPSMRPPASAVWLKYNRAGAGRTWRRDLEGRQPTPGRPAGRRSGSRHV